MQRTTIIAVVAVTAIGLAACQAGTRSTQRIVLPEGSISAGEAAFVELECTACHTVAGEALPDAEEIGPVTIALGGNVTRAKSYDELVTSVINPSHRLARNPFRQTIEQDGESVMPIYNDIMTVTQLVDIVAFLDAKYDVIERPGYRYPVYNYN